MMLFWLAFLLACFPGASTKSPIFGPAEVSGVEGNSVSIKCYYPNTSVNRHTRKYWCRQRGSGPCMTLVSSEGFVSQNYAGRANLTNFPDTNTFVVNIDQLTQDDSGSYKCGLGINNRGLSFDVSLEVSQVPGPLDDTHVYTEDVGRTVNIICPFESENVQKKKSLCKKTGQACETVVDTTGNTSPSYRDRIKLSLQGTIQTQFKVTISHLRPSDTGMYVCKAGDGPSANTKNIDLQVLEPEPELVYGDLRSSVTFDCALGPEMAREPKFLCRMGKEGACDVVINTLGTRDPAFVGRILLTPREDNGRVSVLLTGLRKEDAGRYLCGAHSSGLFQEGWPIQAWQVFVNEETTMPQTRSVVKGVEGGSVSVLCPYNPKDSNSLKYWCRWDGTQNGRCPLLVESQGLVQDQYEGRLALYEEPGNGTYTVILNQLTSQDAGFYWCLTNGDSHWRTTIELKVVEGEPSLKVPKQVTAVQGQSVKIPCHFPCKFYAYEKYWCKWSNTGCQALPSQDEGPSEAFVHCDQNSRLVSMTLNPVSKEDEGWYWCGVKQGHVYGDTAAVYVAVEETAQGSRDATQVNTNAAPKVKVAESGARELMPDNKAVLNPRLTAEETVLEERGDQAQEGRASAGAGSDGLNPSSSSEGHGNSSQVLLSTLVPLGLVLAVGAIAVWVARVRHRKNVDRISLQSYRTDISMADFNNSRVSGGNDNMGASAVTLETVIEAKEELETTTEVPTDPEEPKKAKRSSKEEADMAYSAFLLQSNNLAARLEDGPREV
ncbi:polymeric immunoglobulin receptor [Perognathus longimembris pacificus]|uniref:polymeric immunoglobulin receptor n=1 Tax=Perognathus longimembris pacificus TaxID=214514 RepID=UPI002019D58C|nr:polymeric immunoglobulin receptor [Perognathus longimembris pacificus]